MWCQSWQDFLDVCTDQIRRGAVFVKSSDPPPVGEQVEVRIRGPEDAELVLLGKVIQLVPPNRIGGQSGVRVHLFKPSAEAVESLTTLARRARDAIIEEARESSPGLSMTDFEAQLGRELDFDLEQAPPVTVPRAPAAPGSTPPEPAPGRLRQFKARTATAQGAPGIIGKASPVIGMDFGTSYSKTAIVVDGEVVLIEDSDTDTATPAAIPSAVAFLQNGNVVVGNRARELRAIDPAHVVVSVKRLLGLRYHDPLATGVLGSLACRTMDGPNDSILFDMRGQPITVPEVVSSVLQYMKSMADRWTGTNVKKAVMTVPVEFGVQARRELRLAAKMAGIEVVGMLEEPVAAAMGCGYDGNGESLVAVYDFGGGTFDASMVQIGEKQFNVRGAAGDRWLGGDDFDEAMARYVADEFHKTSGVRIHTRAEEWQRLLYACEEAKRWLSTLHVVNVTLPRAAMTPEGAKTLLVPVTRACFDDLTADVIGSTLVLCSQALSKEGLTPEQVTEVLVTGGTTRVPAVQHAVRRFFDREPMSGIHPEHSVVIGAAVHAAALGGQQLPADSIERLRGGGVVGHTIGLALADGTTEHIIEKSQRPPVAAFKLYATWRDSQTACRIEILEGSSQQSSENRRLGGFVIDALPQAPAGAVELEVYFELSSTGTLCVTAQERTTGRRERQTFDVKLA